jgi:hypothetical protein
VALAAGRAERDTARAMSQENVEVVRRTWAALNEDPPRVLLRALMRVGSAVRIAGAWNELRLRGAGS